MTSTTLVNVGAIEPTNGIHGMLLAFGRKSFAGSVIGGIAPPVTE